MSEGAPNLNPEINPAEQAQVEVPPEQRMPATADMTAEMFDQAAQTSQHIVDQAREFDSQRHWGRHSFYEGSSEDIVRAGADPAEIQNLKRATKIMSDSQRENEARDIIAAGGVDPRDDRNYASGKRNEGVYVPGDNKRVAVNKSLNAGKRPVIGAEWTMGAEDPSRYGVDSDGNAYHDTNFGQQYATHKNTNTHVFNPEHQERAKELIQKLADKQGERQAAARRQHNLDRAQAHVNQANKSPEPPEQDHDGDVKLAA